MPTLELTNSVLLVLVLFAVNDLRKRLMRIEALHLRGNAKEK